MNENAEPLVLISGEGAADATFWNPMLDILQPAGPVLPLALLDLTTGGLDEAAEALAAQAGSLGGAHLAGHGLGAVVAALAAGRHPGLALTVTAIGAAASADPAFLAALAAWRAAARAGVAAEVALPLLFSRYSLNTGLPEALAFQVRPPGPNLFARWGDLLADLGDRRKAFRALDVPVLAMVGGDDTLAPLAYTHEIVEWARTALLVQVSHAGHMAPLENPREVAQVLGGFTARFRDLGGTNAEWFDALEDDEEDESETDPIRHLPFDN